jgi:predicted helicase
VRQGLNEDITDAANLVELLRVFFSYTEPQLEEWNKAVEEFAPRIPDIAKGVKELLDKESKKNKTFVTAFDGFVQLCRQAINPNLSEDAVETMLIQHMLTERIFRKVFDNPEFTRRNIIAIEIEKVIKTITDKRFSRDEFLKELDYFYGAIEDNARKTTDYSEKQTFLNKVYERFFQGFSPKEADTHGIVYTPQPIVNFMVRSVEEILKKEFGKSLGDREVHILDPFVGTGNFLVRVMQEIPKTRLQYKYENELHCNEVMLLPYYIASMNIEHAYLEATGEYKPFEGICLVDTFELAEASQPSLFTAANTERVERQKRAPIFVIIGNPPYNAGQLDENDQNRNRKYPVIDRRIGDTYIKNSDATLLNSLSDPYVKAFRWASDRIGSDGVIAFVSNNSFVDNVSFDGMRECLQDEFTALYVLDLGGNVRKNPKLSGTTHNVFGIKVGVSINLLVKNSTSKTSEGIYYFSTDEYWRKERKYEFLEATQSRSGVKWQKLLRIVKPGSRTKPK